MTQTFQRMAENNLWSNHRLQQACLPLEAEDYHAPRKSFFGSLHATLVHILVVDQLYLARMSEGARPQGGVRDEASYPDRTGLFHAQEACDRELLAFCSSLDEVALSRVVRFTNQEGVANADRIASVLTHLFVHQIHHRGQVHQLLSTTAARPPQLDEFFLSGDRPRRAAEMQRLQLTE